MKTGDVKLEKELLPGGSPSKAPAKKEDPGQAPVIVTLFPLLSMLVAILPGILKHSPGTETVKTGILVLILTGIASFYIKYYYGQLQVKKLAKTIIILGYLVSICLLLYIPNPEYYNFWMLGGLLVAILVDKKLGLLLHFNLSFLLGIAITMNVGTVLQVLVMGVMLCFLSGALQSKSTIIYAAIILLSMDITVAFVINNFKFDRISNYDYLLSMLSLLVVILLAFLISGLYYSMLAAAGDGTDNVGGTVLSAQEVGVTSVRTEEEPYAAMLSQGTRTDYSLLCDLNNVLLQRMRDYSEALYQHALRIGDLSRRAAKEIGADEALAFAGGLYHEMGKMVGKNYIEEGLFLAEEYGFPGELKTILREHNIKYEKPSSVEAVIVMLADNIVTTIEYIEKNDDHKFTEQKIIENIFRMRLDKGTFDSANIALRDYKKLKEFFVSDFSVKQEQ
ncbi:MAG TPA: HD domain-containing protein [Clostridiales bacterium]|nr:HD domain-containing protein [Clostridiales bacterium]